MTSIDSRQFYCKVKGIHSRIEWVAECHCATDGTHYQGYKCLDCGEKFAIREARMTCRCGHGAERHYNDGRGSSCRDCECQQFSLAKPKRVPDGARRAGASSRRSQGRREWLS